MQYRKTSRLTRQKIFFYETFCGRKRYFKGISRNSLSLGWKLQRRRSRAKITLASQRVRLRNASSEPLHLCSALKPANRDVDQCGNFNSGSARNCRGQKITENYHASCNSAVKLITRAIVGSQTTVSTRSFSHGERNHPRAAPYKNHIIYFFLYAEHAREMKKENFFFSLRSDAASFAVSICERFFRKLIERVIYFSPLRCTARAESREWRCIRVGRGAR